MLFTGVGGIGKRSAAIAFAMACNCSGGVPTVVSSEENASSRANLPEGAMPNSCGHCRSCKKIQADTHPDIVRIEPSGQLIRIARIREVLDILAMKPYEARLRVVIISDAHAMNLEAGNALLKILEEPPEHTILILTASGIADLLPTIVSRCRLIRFNPLSIHCLASMLVDKENVSPDRAGVLAAMADGSFSRALSLFRENWIEKRIRLIRGCGLLMDDPSGRGSLPALGALALELIEKKAGIEDALRVLTSFYRDLLVVKFQKGPLINEDLSERIRSASERLPETAIMGKLEAIETTRKQIRGNSNPRLAMELLLMRLTDYLPAATGSA